MSSHLLVILTDALFSGNAGFAGVNCETCAAGFWGPSCTACTCDSTGGVCSGSGSHGGDGSCQCNAGVRSLGACLDSRRRQARDRSHQPPTSARTLTLLPRSFAPPRQPTPPPAQFTGPTCSQCKVSNYGPTCAACAACSSVGGTCDGGGSRSGSGACICETGWGGSDCTCPSRAARSSLRPPLSSPRLASPCLASPRLAFPRVTSPRVASSCLTTPLLFLPLFFSSRLASPRLASPRLVSPRLVFPFPSRLLVRGGLLRRELRAVQALQPVGGDVLWERHERRRRFMW